jgi:hypothetical protein
MSETLEYKGYEIKIENDTCPLNPRKDWDGHVGTMVCFHSRYDLGDDHEHTVESLNEFLSENDCIALPLYLYDHSGITMNTTGFSCGWDSGKVGVIYATYDHVKEMFGWKRLTKKRIEKIKTYLKGEVETYDDYLTGAVYGYTISKDDEEIEDGSCWGYFGYDHEKSGLLETAKEVVNADIKWTLKKQFNKVKELILNKVPFLHRPTILASL